MTVRSPVAAVSCRSSAHCSQAWKPRPRRAARRSGRAGVSGRRSSCGPGAPVAAVLVGDCAPGREVLQRPALLVAPAGEGLAAAVREEDAHEHLPLARPDRVPVDQRSVDSARPASSSRSTSGARHLRHPQVERVAEPPGGRQVGAGLLAGGRGDGVQRVDQHEARPLVGGHPASRAQVAEVADAPAGAGRVAYSCTAQPQARSSGSQHRPGETKKPTTAALRRLQPVVAEREVVGELAVDVRTSPSSQTTSASSTPRVARAGDDRGAFLQVRRGRPMTSRSRSIVSGRPRAPRPVRPASSRRCPTRRWSVSVRPVDPRRGGESPQPQGRGRARFVADATAGSSGHGCRG